MSYELTDPYHACLLLIAFAYADTQVTIDPGTPETYMEHFIVFHYYKLAIEGYITNDRKRSGR